LQLIRFIYLLIGLVCTAAAVALRYSPSAITAEDGQVSFRLFRTGGASWLTLPVWLLWLMAIIVLAVAVWSSSAGRNTARTLLARRRQRLPTLVAIALLFLTVLPVSYSRVKATDQSIITYLVLATLGTIGLVVGAGPALDVIARPLMGLYEWLQRRKTIVFVTGAAVFVFLASNLISWRVFEHIPRIHDNVAQLFQARLFAQGKLFAPSPPFPQFFDMMLMVNDGRWYSQYPPGHPLMLMLGVLIGMPWIVNPLLGALTVGVIYLLGKELYDERTARLGALLACLSPFLILMSSQFMNHTSSLFFATLFTYGYVRSVKRPMPAGKRFFLAASSLPLLTGLALGMVVLVRPYTALLVALPFALDAAYRVGQAKFRNLGPFVLMTFGAGIMVGLLMLYNQTTTGNPLELGYVTRYGPGHGLGFGSSGWGQVYTVAKALAATSLDLNAVNRCLFEFPIPGLFFVAFLFATARARRSDFLLLGVFGSLVVGHFFYWWHDLLFGPRWEYEAIPALLLLTARGLRVLPEFAQELAGDRAPARRNAARLLAFGCLSLLAVAVPNLIRRIPETFGIRTEMLRAVQRTVVKPALVVTPRIGDVFLENRVPPGGDIVYAADLGELDPMLAASSLAASSLARAFPGRNFYYATLDSVRAWPPLDFEHSALKEGLDSTAAELNRNDLHQFRSLFWPADELTYMVQPLAQRYGMRLFSYRTLDRLSVSAVNRVPVSFPAIAAWVLGDKSEHVVVFGKMNQGESFSAGGLSFNLIGTSPNGLVALYAIYPGR
jgi:uncharacterized membrane protein